MSQLYQQLIPQAAGFYPAEIDYLLTLSAELKRAKKTASETQYLKGKNIALIFEKDSTRTDALSKLPLTIRGKRHLPRPKRQPDRP